MIGFSKDVLPSGDAVFHLFFALVCLFMYIYVVVSFSSQVIFVFFCLGVW